MEDLDIGGFDNIIEFDGEKLVIKCRCPHCEKIMTIKQKGQLDHIYLFRAFSQSIKYEKKGD